MFRREKIGRSCRENSKIKSQRLKGHMKMQKYYRRRFGKGSKKLGSRIEITLGNG
jgi:hypothetical protein